MLDFRQKAQCLCCSLSYSCILYVKQLENFYKYKTKQNNKHILSSRVTDKNRNKKHTIYNWC